MDFNEYNFFYFSCIACGLIQAQYAFHNISNKSYTTVKYFGKMIR